MLGVHLRMIHKSTLPTERLEIRPFAASDSERLIALFEDPQVHRFVDDGGPLSREVAAEWVANSRANLERYGYGTGAIVERASNRLVGWAGIARPPGDLAEIIYGFERSAWGKGYGREVLNALIAFSREQGELPVRATVDVGNARSVKLLEAAGFRRTSDCYKGDSATLLYELE